MRLASVITPFTDENLQLAAQTGVTDVTTRYPGPNLADLQAVIERVGRFGLRISAIEGYLPIEEIKLRGAAAGEEIAAMKQLIRNMAGAGVHVLCYNFMAGTDWVRTKLDEKERGGALVTRFDIDQAEVAVSLRDDAQAIPEEVISAEQLWTNLEQLLDELLPTAEECGVYLAMHPDDPPLDSFRGRARIMNSVENFERLVNLRPSSSNAVCFCQGTFAEMGADIPTAIRRLGPHIRFVHFRDIRGDREHFMETFHDTGQTNMYQAIKAYREVGFDGPIRPDHVPQLVGEEDGTPGYTMLGRLFAYGYMKGLMQAAEQEMAKAE